MTAPIPAVPAAAVLHRAAALLKIHAEAAQKDLDTDSYWKPYDKATAWRDGFVNGFGGVCSDLVALLPPAAVVELARWLEHEAEIARAAELWAEREPCGWCGNPANHHALAVARAVLGEEQP